mmetsp:Transcript_102609/g.313793  ORF Transcript_102609/g.313793 Transcript_102609/m.313793 type:complete len:262 (-) Transcript_102609:329-1114(-)
MKASRRLRSSRYARAASAPVALDFASASNSAACLSSLNDDHTRNASSGGCSSWSSSLRAMIVMASFHRSLVRLSSRSDAINRWRRTTQPALPSRRDFLCFSSSRSITVWNTSSRRMSDLINPQASSPASNFSASSYVVVRSSGLQKRSSMSRSNALAAARSFFRASICFCLLMRPMSSAKHCFRMGSLRHCACGSSRVASLTPCHVQASSTPFSFRRSQKSRRFSALVWGMGLSSTPELSPLSFRNSGGVLQQLTLVSLLK